MSATYLYTEANGVEVFSVVSAYNIYDSQTLRVLRPNKQIPGMEHNFLFILPVEKGEDFEEYGDAMEVMQKLNVPNDYNLTLIEPLFEIYPWYANHPTNKKYQYESFMVSELVPWVKDNLATSKREQNWLIGFSKSGYGAIDLIFKHPETFRLAAAWDFPANMSIFDQFGNGENFGTDENFQTNYRLTDKFVETNKTYFLKENRIWISGFSAFGDDIKNFDNLLSQKDIQHTIFPQEGNVHNWDSAWVPQAIEGLYKNSINLPKVKQPSHNWLNYLLDIFFNYLPSSLLPKK